MSTVRAQCPPSPVPPCRCGTGELPLPGTSQGKRRISHAAGRYVQLSGRSTGLQPGMIPVGHMGMELASHGAPGSPMGRQAVPAQMWTSTGQGHDGFTTSGSRAQTRCCSKNTPRPTKGMRHNPRACARWHSRTLTPQASAHTCARAHDHKTAMLENERARQHAQTA